MFAVGGGERSATTSERLVVLECLPTTLQVLFGLILDELIGSWQIPEAADFQRITGSRPTPGEFCLKLASGGRPLHGHEFRCQTFERNFQLRTLWVVTLCSLRPTIALLRRGGRPTMRYDATRCPLRAETLLAALCEASSPIHEDRNGLPQPASAIL